MKNLIGMNEFIRGVRDPEQKKGFELKARNVQRELIESYQR